MTTNVEQDHKMRSDLLNDQIECQYLAQSLFDVFDFMVKVQNNFIPVLFCLFMYRWS